MSTLLWEHRWGCFVPTPGVLIFRGCKVQSILTILTCILCFWQRKSIVPAKTKKNRYLTYFFICVLTHIILIYIMNSEIVLFLLLFIYCSFLCLKMNKIMNKTKTERRTNATIKSESYTPNCHVWLSDILKSRLGLNVLLSPSSFFSLPLRLWFIHTTCCTMGALFAKWDSLNGDLYFQDYICIQLQMIWRGGSFQYSSSVYE